MIVTTGTGIIRKNERGQIFGVRLHNNIVLL